MDDAHLISAAKQGDLGSFNQLVLAYEQLAYNLAYRMLSDAELARDVTQSAFISAFRSLESFRGGSFKAWVMRMVTNGCYDELRRMKRRPTVPLEPLDADDEEIESPAWLADEGPSPEEMAERAEQKQAIQRCLQSLEEDFRAVVVLVDLEGMDYSEAADMMRIPLGTVKSRLARARLKLRDCLHQFWELLPSQFRLEGER